MARFNPGDRDVAYAGHEMKRSRKRMLQGALLGLGAPVGWILLSTLAGLTRHADSTYRLPLLAYMLVGSMLSFGLFGWYAGRKEDRLARLSFIDHLTRAYNTRFFHQALAREFANYTRYGLPLSLVLLDLDHFKRINDTYGHQAGDVVLAEVAETIRGMVRAGDTVARVGGEEFAIIMPGTVCDNALAVAERIREAVRERRIQTPDGVILKVRASLGVAGTDKLLPTSATDLFARVDRALYRAKALGRDRTMVAGEHDPRWHIAYPSASPDGGSTKS